MQIVATFGSKRGRAERLRVSASQDDFGIV